MSYKLCFNMMLQTKHFKIILEIKTHIICYETLRSIYHTVSIHKLHIKNLISLETLVPITQNGTIKTWFYKIFLGGNIMTLPGLVISIPYSISHKTWWNLFELVPSYCNLFFWLFTKKGWLLKIHQQRSNECGIMIAFHCILFHVLCKKLEGNIMVAPHFTAPSTE